MQGRQIHAADGSGPNGMPGKDAVTMVEYWRGGMLESRHRGHAVIVSASGAIEAAWGDPAAIIYPRSSCKMIQALPLVESGAAGQAGLGSEELALACASHLGAPIHVERVRRWLEGLDLGEADLRCGAHWPRAFGDRLALHEAGEEPCQLHNNCSGKHAGFLTLGRHLRAGSEYIDPAHPVQRAVRAAFEEMTGEESPRFAVDGCSAPNFATSLTGLARAAARMARPAGLGRAREEAARTLIAAMIAHPLLVAGEGGADSELMPAAPGVAIKGGAEGVHLAILPERGLGIAVKMEDGAARASEAAIAALLIHLGVLAADHPAARKYTAAAITNWRGIDTGALRADVRSWTGRA
jgi:L-asparaginase II